MKRNSILSVVIIALFLVVAGVISCSKTSNQAIKEERGFANVNLDLRNMPKEAIQLKELKDEIAERVIGNGISKTMMENAVRTQDITELKKAIKMSDEEYHAYSLKLSFLKEELLRKYPQIQDEIDLRKEYKSCNLENSSLFLTKLTGKNPSKNDLISIEPYFDANAETAAAIGVDCQWVQYTACLLICTSTGPILYWLCAALCVDTYCHTTQE